MMDKIKRKHWIAVTERLPDDGVICLITGGNDVAVAVADVERKSVLPSWGIAGVTGYEWEISFTPTHWMALSVELPSDQEGEQMSITSRTDAIQDAAIAEAEDKYAANYRRLSHGRMNELLQEAYDLARELEIALDAAM